MPKCFSFTPNAWRMYIFSWVLDSFIWDSLVRLTHCVLHYTLHTKLIIFPKTIVSKKSTTTQKQNNIYRYMQRDSSFSSISMWMERDEEHRRYSSSSSSYEAPVQRMKEKLFKMQVSTRTVYTHNTLTSTLSCSYLLRSIF